MAGRTPTSRYNNTYNLNDDVDDATFLKYSGGSSAPISDQTQRMLQEKREIEARTLASTQRSLQLLNDSETVGAATAEELYRQREQLENTEQKLDDINASLRISERHIQSIKSVFGSIKNYFSGSKEAPASTKAASDKSNITNGSSVPRSKSGGLADVLENSTKNESRSNNQSSSSSSYQAQSQDYYDRRTNNPNKEQDVEAILEQNLDGICTVLGRLKTLGRDMGEELSSQNNLIERITTKAEDTDWKMEKQNKDMNKILKR